MPFSTSQVTVERVCNGLNFGDTPSFINSEKATGVDRQANLVQLHRSVKSVYGVLEYACTLFEDLCHESEKVNQRIFSLANRVEAIKGILPKLEKKIEDNFVHQELVLERIECAITFPETASAITPLTRNVFVRNALERADPPPNLEVFDPLRSDGKRTLTEFTNPKFFLQNFAAAVEAELTQKHLSKSSKHEEVHQPQVPHQSSAWRGLEGSVIEEERVNIGVSLEPVALEKLNLEPNVKVEPQAVPLSSLDASPPAVEGQSLQEAYQNSNLENNKLGAEAPEGGSTSLALALSQALQKRRVSAETEAANSAAKSAPPIPPPVSAKPSSLAIKRQTSIPRVPPPPPPPPPMFSSTKVEPNDGPLVQKFNEPTVAAQANIPPPPPPPHMFSSTKVEPSDGPLVQRFNEPTIAAQANIPPPPPPPPMFSSTKVEHSEGPLVQRFNEPTIAAQANIPPPPPPMSADADRVASYSADGDLKVEGAVSLKPTSALAQRNSPGGYVDKRSELLADIRVGAFKLRKIEDLNKAHESGMTDNRDNARASGASASGGAKGNIFGNLASSKAAALASNNPFSEVATILARRVALGGSSSGDSESESDSGGDEWK